VAGGAALLTASAERGGSELAIEGEARAGKVTRWPIVEASLDVERRGARLRLAGQNPGKGVMRFKI